MILLQHPNDAAGDRADRSSAEPIEVPRRRTGLPGRLLAVLGLWAIAFGTALPALADSANDSVNERAPHTVQEDDLADPNEAAPGAIPNDWPILEELITPWPTGQRLLIEQHLQRRFQGFGWWGPIGGPFGGLLGGFPAR